MHCIEIFIDRVAVLDSEGLYPLCMVTAIGSLDLVDHEVATLQRRVAGPGEGMRVQAAPPMIVKGELATPP